MTSRRVLVTGGNRGIGRAIAEAFVAEGATVWATDKDVALLDGVTGSGKKIDVVQPHAHAKVLGTLRDGTRADARKAIDAASLCPIQMGR